MTAPFSKNALSSAPAPVDRTASSESPGLGGDGSAMASSMSSAATLHAGAHDLTGVPQELVEALGPSLVHRLVEGLQEMLQELRKEPKDSDEPVDEKSLKAFLDGAVSDLPAMLRLFEGILPSEAWTSRILMFEPAPAPTHWRFEGVYAAEPHLLSGGLSGLDELMDGLKEKVEPGSAALWVHGVEMDGQGLFLAYLRWPGSRPVLLTLQGGTWGHVEVSRHRQLVLLQLVLGADPGDKKRWKAFMSAQAGWLHENMREDFDEILSKWGLEALSDEQWNELVRVAYVNKSMLRLYQESARAMSEEPLLEAHGLLKAVAKHFDSQVKFFEQRKAQLEKDLEKKTKRLRSDLERSEMLAKGSQARARRLQEENAQLHRQMQRQGAGQAAAPEDLVSALDQLFLA